MKRMIIIILTVFLIFALFSCGKTVSGGETSGAETDTETETGTETGGMHNQTSPDIMKYGIIPGDYFFSGNGGLVKYNVHTGSVTTVCPDPFCRHDDSCQFSGVYGKNFTVVGNTVYYIHKDDETGGAAIFSFDVDTTETKMVYSPGLPLAEIYSYEYKLLIRQYDSSDRGAKSGYIWLDTKTGKTSKLYEDSFLKNYVIYSIINDRIIWLRYTVDGNPEYYSTDLDGKDLKEYDFGYKYGNYYESEKEFYEDGTPYYNVYVTLKGETERKLLIQNTMLFIYCENKIVYTKKHPRAEWKVIRYFSKEYSIYDFTCGDVYIMDPDGSNDHLLVHIDEGIRDLTPGYPLHRMMNGDYIGIELYKFDEEGADIYGCIMIVDINTGEYVLSKPVWEDK